MGSHSRVNYPAAYLAAQLAKVEGEDVGDPSFVDSFIASVATSWRRLVRGVRSTIPAEGRIDVGEVVRDARSHIESFADELEGHTVLAGQASAVEMTRRFAPERPGIRLTFRPSDQTVVSALLANRNRVTDSLTAQINEALTDIGRDINMANTIGAAPAVQDAQPRPRTRAEIRRDLVLTNYQRKVVDNYRASLEAGRADALNRVLRDHRFDPTVARAVSGDRALTPTQINRMVDRYAARQLNFRAETIAITEGVRIANEGQDLFLRQAFARGDLNPETTTRTWVTQGDERVRGSHRTMNGQTRPLDQPYISGAGYELRFPGDPNAPRSETIRCRCWIRTDQITPAGNA